MFLKMFTRILHQTDKMGLAFVFLLCFGLVCGELIAFSSRFGGALEAWECLISDPSSLF